MSTLLRVLCGGMDVGQLAENNGTIVFQYEPTWLP